MTTELERLKADFRKCYLQAASFNNAPFSLDTVNFVDQLLDGTANLDGFCTDVEPYQDSTYIAKVLPDYLNKKLPNGHDLYAICWYICDIVDILTTPDNKPRLQMQPNKFSKFVELFKSLMQQNGWE